MLYSALLFVPSSTASANAVRCIGREAIARVINKTNQMQKNSVPRGPVYTLYRPPPSHASKVDASLSRGFHVQVSLTFLSLLTASVGRSGHPQHPYLVYRFQPSACLLAFRPQLPAYSSTLALRFLPKFPLLSTSTQRWQETGETIFTP